MTIRAVLEEAGRRPLVKARSAPILTARRPAASVTGNGQMMVTLDDES
jgi:hypothetical protein